MCSGISFVSGGRGDRFFFFFQAEDGIRDRNVTGVQTCALPICHGGSGRRLRAVPRGRPATGGRAAAGASWAAATGARLPCRSEERRVGKECRSRWSRHDQKEKV